MKNWKTCAVVVVGIIFFALMCVFGVQGSSDIKVQEKRRINLLPNLVDCVKQYDKHEAETLQAIVDGRGRSNENYKQLMTELATTENMIAQYRESYNKQVGTYNRYVKGFPARQFLSWTGYEVLDYQRLDYQAPVDAPTNLFGE